MYYNWLFLTTPTLASTNNDGFGGLVVSMLASGLVVSMLASGSRVFSDVKKSSACLLSEGK
jgi:hypothetical protein